MKLGIQYRYQQGEIQVNHKRFLGYTKDENKRLVIVPEESEVVKRIYREYLEGASLLQIARGLEADGILTSANKPKCRPETLRVILQNEKYIGDALLQKTYTEGFLSKKRVVNNGIVPQYYVENSHEPIIPREIFMQVQRRWSVGLICKLEKAANDESTAASTHCPVLCIAESAGIFTVGYIGTTEDANPSFGDVSAVLRKEALIVPLGLLMRLHCKRP